MTDGHGAAAGRDATAQRDPVTGRDGMVGREAELAGVTALVDGVREGRGGVLLVLGEAGIGKSRLLAEAARHARDAGLLVLTGRSVEGGGAYRPLAEALMGHLRQEGVGGGAELGPYRAALGRLLPEWAGEASATSVDPVLVLGEGLVRLLWALNGRRGCVVVLEDVHWADPDTLAVLEYLAGAVHACPVLIAVSAREEESPPQLIDRLAARPGTRTMRLERLVRDGVKVLAERCAGAALPERTLDLVADKSDGLPLLVEELVAGDLQAGVVPPTLAGMVTARLRSLSDEHRRVLEAAAVLGAEAMLGGGLDWELLGKVTGLPDGTVVRALRAAQPRLVVPAGDTLRWRHALTREAVVASTFPPERAALARRAADALLERGGPDDDLHAAELFAAAGDKDRAAEIFLRLAKRDLDRGALRDAGALLERAGATAALQAAVALERIRLLTLLGKADTALAEGGRLIDQATGDDHALLCVRLADAAISLRRWADADRFLQRAGRPDDPGILVLTADAAFGPGDLPRAARLAMTAIDQARANGRPEAHCRALVILGRCIFRHDVAAARTFYEQAAQIAAEHGLRPWRISALINIATVELCAHPLTPILDQARELAVDTGRLAEVITTDLLNAEGVLLVNGPHAAAPLARATAEHAARLRLPNLQAVAELTLAHGHAADADIGGMQALLDSATGHPEAPAEVAALAPVVRGFRFLLDGDLHAAGPLFDAGMKQLEGHCEAAPVPHWGLWALLRTVLADRTDRDDRDDTARDLVRGSYVVLRSVNRGVLHYADAVAAGRAERSGEAIEHMAAGDALLAEHHWWRRLCRLLAMQAAITDGWGDPVPGLRADLAAFEETGQHRLARTCRDLLRRAGAPTRRSRGTHPVPTPLRAAGVTGREMEVLTLLAHGLTNRQIAQRLFLSPRTIDTHVANLLTKTGATDRTQLRAHLAATAARP
ncbi:AAA family ATPase [Actinomadura barringtoniae]|uniref:AAA family ATPase n=1 Tax=Actinomadura barringtoniae TaxID=1427535 RepID=A0A939PK43_9ACTN|nr:LuxR family transcriptional regulator [Actinomadura barringtoniae]MBO2453815.1 AAA family ATPase [Actinomadura barringtoniae]